MEQNTLSLEPEIHFHLAASGSFDPDYITRVLELQLTQAKKKGDWAARVGEARVKFDIWYMDSLKTRGYKFVDYLLEFLKNFESKEEVFKNLLEKDSISFHLIAYVSMFHGMERPELRLEKILKQRLIDFGFILDIVIYCECCDEDGDDNG
jgi:hypothetical protein